MKNRIHWMTGIVVAGILLTANATLGQFGQGSPKAKVDLVSSVEAIVSGQPFDLAIRFKINPGWHIYWQNSGDSGQPPRVNWKLPAGFKAGALQFPVPKRHHSAGNITTNILEGQPALLVRITPPDAATTDRVTIESEVQYLICKDICLRETAALRLDLPVHSTTTLGRTSFSRLRAQTFSA